MAATKKPGLKSIVGDGSSRVINMPEAGNVRYMNPAPGDRITRDPGRQSSATKDSNSRRVTGKET